jgi:8-oxo-dGTP pyrophosphatase MutT (NUDIX family)
MGGSFCGRKIDRRVDHMAFSISTRDICIVYRMVCSNNENTQNDTYVKYIPPHKRSNDKSLVKKQDMIKIQKGVSVPCQVYGTIIVSPYKRVLLVQGRETGKWSFPKGHITEQDSQLCAIRETFEETGIVLPNVVRPRFTFTAGKYYLYYLDHEPSVKVGDCKEIMDYGWFSEEELKSGKLLCNVDVSVFIKRYLRLLQKKSCVEPTSLDHGASPVFATDPCQQLSFNSILISTFTMDEPVSS